MELDLGIRLYQRRLSKGSKVDALFTYDQTLGACILLNANFPLERRIQSAAHELGHFVGTRQAPEVLEENEKFQSREERYAHAFGRAFLSPRKSFEAAWRQLTAGSEITRRPIIVQAHHFRISREACVRRLEELGLVKRGAWDKLKAHGGIAPAQVREVLGDASSKSDPAKDDANRPVSHRMSFMAYTAWKRDLMSEGQLAELLKIKRLELRALLDQMELEESETDDLFKLPL